MTTGMLGIPRSHPDYYKTWYSANREQVLERVRLWRLDRRAFIDAIKVEKGCADCGYRAHAIALDFDHVDGVKLGHVGSMTPRVSMRRLLAEIEKCEVVCANCHRVRTDERRFQRGGRTLADDTKETKHA